MKALILFLSLAFAVTTTVTAKAKASPKIILTCKLKETSSSGQVMSEDSLTIDLIFGSTEEFFGEQNRNRIEVKSKSTKALVILRHYGSEFQTKTMLQNENSGEKIEFTGDSEVDLKFINAEKNSIQLQCGVDA